MTLEEAIEIVDNLALIGTVEIDQEDAAALRLGKEALKRELNNRSGSKYVIVAPLKGETKAETQA